MLAPTTGSTQARANDLGGFYGVIYTPAGALPPIVRVQSPADSGSRGVVDLRYGRYKFRDDTLTFNNFGAAGEVRVFRRLRLAGTLALRTCSTGCEALTMASVDAAATLLRYKGTEPEAGHTELDIQVSAGYGKPAKLRFRTRSLTVLLPFTVTLPQSAGGLLTLSMVPGAALGRLQDNAGEFFTTPGTYGSTRFLIGLAVGYLSPVGLGVHGGVHRIASEEGIPQSGLGVSWRF